MFFCDIVSYAFIDIKPSLNYSTFLLLKTKTMGKNTKGRRK